MASNDDIATGPGGRRQDLDRKVGPGAAGPLAGNQGSGTGVQDFGAGGQRRGAGTAAGEANPPPKDRPDVTPPLDGASRHPRSTADQPSATGGGGTAASGADVTGGRGAGRPDTPRAPTQANGDIGFTGEEPGGTGVEGNGPGQPNEPDNDTPALEHVAEFGGIDDQAIEDLRADGARDMAADRGYGTDHRGVDGTEGGVGEGGRQFANPDSTRTRPGQESGLGEPPAMGPLGH